MTLPPPPPVEARRRRAHPGIGSGQRGDPSLMLRARNCRSPRPSLTALHAIRGLATAASPATSWHGRLALAAWTQAETCEDRHAASSHMRQGAQQPNRSGA